MTKEKSGKEEEHVVDMDEVIVEVKASAAITIWEAKIKLAEDFENVGSWNVARWRETLGKLNGEPLGASQNPVLHPKEGGEKTEVAPGGGDQSAS